VIIYPDPVLGTQSTVYISLNVSRIPQSVTMNIYTASFREIRTIEWTAGMTAGDNVLSLPVWKLGQVSSGTYYYVIIAKDAEGQTARSKAGEFIILR
jgi:hypothetical protein